MKDQALLAQKPLVDQYLNNGLRPLSSFSFVSLFAWCDFFDFEFKIFDSCLCIFAHSKEGVFLYLPPLGKNIAQETITSVFHHMMSDGKIRPINRIENIPGNLLSCFQGSSYNQYSKPVEYVYRKEDLSRLHGNAYKSQRHDCNHFVTHHKQYVFEAYTDVDRDACMSLYQRWAEERAAAHSDEIYRSMLEENFKVHGRLLKFHQELGLVVRVLRVEGKIAGYTFGYPLDENTFCVYAEIADLSLKGIAAFMFQQFCSDQALKRFSRINTMDDFAMPNVARAKQAYHPSEKFSSYTISLKSGK
jgi:hypothetical protein